MPIIFKKLTLSLLSALIVLFSVVPNFSYVQAQESTWYNIPFSEWYPKVFDETISPPTEIFGERYTAAQVQWVVWSLLSLPINILGRDNQQAVGCMMKYIGQNTIDGSECTSAVVGLFNKFIDFITPTLAESTNSSNLAELMFNTQNRPISGIVYTSELLSKFNPVSEVKAQGFGYGALNPIQIYWTGVRNVAYSIIVLVVIVFAFMIMFKVKITPQTIITVQSALPKVIIALILATFSYAIAGFLIDLMYVFGGLLASMLSVAGIASSAPAAYEGIFPQNDYGFYILTNLLVYDIFFLIGLLWSFIATFSTFSGPLIIFGTLISVAGLLVVVWLLVLSIWYTFKISWVLIKNLISVYFSIIIAPIQIVLGALVPQIGFGTWLKKMAAELSVFPLTGLFLFLAWKLMWTSYGFNLKILASKSIFADIINEVMGLFGANTQLVDVIWVPSIIGFGESLSGFILLLMSFGIIIALPKVVNIVKAAIMGERFTYGDAINEAMAPYNWARGTPAGRAIGEYAGYRSGASVLNSRPVRATVGWFGGTRLGQRLGVPSRDELEDMSGSMQGKTTNTQ
ncbi:hypothetical protein ACFL1Q_00875 [Patescibacteria group bacterium]